MLFTYMWHIQRILFQLALQIDFSVCYCVLICLFVQTAEEAMTPIESTFSLDLNSKLDC